MIGPGARPDDGALAGGLGDDVVGGEPPRARDDLPRGAAEIGTADIGAADIGADAVAIRPLVTPAELRACVALQHETWGADFDETVPPAILRVCQRLGGVAAGAFDRDGRLLGFVFGLTGVERGRVVHWSDMLAVRPELRDAGLGRRLKTWQRDAARAAGAGVMYWTFDPLVARNAHLNFNRLGVRAHEYVEDMYGQSASVLHRGLGTDRLVVAWPLAGPPAASCCPDGDPAALPPALRDAPLLGAPEDDAPVPPADAPTAAAYRIPIPSDVHGVVGADPAAAVRWRSASRAAFQWALARGFGVAGLHRDDTGLRAYYVMTRTGAEPAPPAGSA